MNGRSSQRERAQEPTVQERVNQQVQQLQEQGYTQIGVANFNNHICRVFQNEGGQYRAVREDDAHLYRSSSLVKNDIAPLVGRTPFEAHARAEERTGAGAGAAAPATEAEQARTAPTTGEAETAARSQRRGLSSNWTRVPNVEWAGMGQMYVRLDRLDQAARTEFERLNMAREPDYQTWVRDHIDRFPLAFTTPRLGDRSTRE